MKLLRILAAALFFTLPAWGTTYYIAATGSDSNNGTSETTPWLHFPYMSSATGNPAAYSCNAGDVFTPRGGDSWHFDSTAPAITTWSWACAGTSGSYVVIGQPDFTWFNSAVCGASYCLPTLTGDNPTSTTFVASCTNDDSSLAPIGVSTAFTQWEYFNMTGVCWSTQAASSAYMALSGTTTIGPNLFCHGWTMTSGAADNYPCFTAFGGGTYQVTVDQVTVDGSDSPHYPAGGVISGSTVACQWSSDANFGISNVVENSSSVVTLTVGGSFTAYLGGGIIGMSGLTTATWLNGQSAAITAATATTVTFTDPTSHGTLASTAETGGAGMSPCASGQALNGSHFTDIHKSIFRYVSNMIVSANFQTMHDNLFEFLEPTFASGSVQQHSNVINALTSTGGAIYVYNNVFRHIYGTEAEFLPLTSNLYYFNNIHYDMMHSVFGPLATACVRLNSTNSSLSSLVTAYIVNNTFGDNTCAVQLAPVNSPLFAFSGTVIWQNNHLVGYTGSSLANFYEINTSGSGGCVSGGTCTITDNGSEVYQTQAAATSQGYTAAGLYQPTLGTNATVGAGANLSGSVATFSLDSALGSGSSAGCSLQSAEGGEIAQCPAVTLNARPTQWDAGAFQFLAPGVVSGVPAISLRDLGIR